jgi:hypothetical protein
VNTSGTRTSLGLEFFGFIIALWIAVALVQDERSTAVHALSLWAAAGLAATPPVSSVLRGGSFVLLDSLAALTMIVPMLVSYTIGGLALAIPASLLGIAALIAYIDSSANLTLRKAMRWLIGLGVVVFVGGIASMGASMIIAPVGLLLVIIGAVSLNQTE